MSNSLQDQFLKLGLVDQKKVREAHVEKQKKHKVDKANKGKKKEDGSNPSAQQENLRMVEEAARKKKERVQTLNREREEKLQKRARLAQIQQIIEQHHIGRDENGRAYRFPVSGKIHSIRVAEETAGKLSKGVLGIVERVGATEDASNRFAVVPKGILDRINGIDPDLFTHIVQTEGSDETDPDDPYAQYKIPDDLIW